MVRYLVSFNWNGFFRSTVIAAFEAYGSALVGIAPLELRPENSLTGQIQPVRRG